MENILKKMATESNERELLSKRAHQAAKEDFLSTYLNKVSTNSFDNNTNPQGYVNLGTAENKVCEDLWLAKISEIVGTPGYVGKHLLFYFPFHGLQCVRKTVGKFIEERFNSKDKIEEEKIILVVGVTAALNAMAFALGDVGDVFLCPTPAYPRLRNDMLDFGGVNIYEVPMFEEDSTDPCEFRMDVLEVYYEKAKEEGLTVRGLIITSPNNPTGKVYTPKELTQMMAFCKRENLHVVFDEIYALSSQGQKCFTSVLSLDIPDPGRTHFIWGISKDFGLSGFRFGVIYSHNISVIAQLQKIAPFSAVPAPTQFLVNDILSDTDWLDNTYFPTYYDRARKSLLLVRDVLDEFRITTAYDCKHVIFIWMNLSQFLKEKTKDNEIVLFDKFMEAGVYIWPGTMLLCHTPGWFRLTYTWPQVEVEEGLRRFRSVLMKTQKDLGVQ